MKVAPGLRTILRRLAETSGQDIDKGLVPGIHLEGTTEGM